MFLKSSTICCIVLMLFVIILAISTSVEAKRNRTKNPNKTSHKNSTKWREYKKKNKLTILQEPQDVKSFDNFEQKDDLIEEHNSNPNKLAELGHNEFSHLSKEEINSKLKGLVILPESNNKRDVSNPIVYSSFNGVKLSIPWFSYVSTPGYTAPASVDWRQRGFNTPIRNQNPCGDCWAFSAAAALEASIYINLNTSVTLSPQQLTDCAGGSFGNNGCNGGFSITAYNYIYNKSISADSYYPFLGRMTTCSYTDANDKTHGNLFTVTKMYQSKAGDDQALMELLDKFGPVTIGMDASSDYFSSYKSGIFASPRSPAGKMCDASNIDHAMLLVGYGVDNTTGEKYWIIKNQWGSTWGEDGYMRVSRDVVNNCGISTWGVLPIASNGATNPTTASTTTKSTTTVATTARPTNSSSSGLICDGNIHADPGCKTGYSCAFNTFTSTCNGGMWSTNSTSATCGQSYGTSCKATAAWTSCTREGIFLAAKCSQRIQCTISKSTYTPPAGQLLDETGPYYRSGWTCPI